MVLVPTLQAENMTLSYLKGEREFGVIEFVKDRDKVCCGGFFVFCLGFFCGTKSAKKKAPLCRVLGEGESMRMHKHRADIGQCPGSYIVLAH